jgi:hypothetical protein
MISLITTYEQRKIFADGLIQSAISVLPPPITTLGTPPSPSSGRGGGTGGYIASSSTLKQVLINAGYVPGTFAFEMALAVGTKEGYKKGSTNRPSRNNNPGNLDGSSFRDIDPGVVLEPPAGDGSRRFAKFTTPELGAKALIEKKIRKWGNGIYPATIVNGEDNSRIDEPNKYGGARTNAEYRRIFRVPSSLKAISGRGVKLTLEQFFYIYAPPHQNNTELYITQIVNTLKTKYPTITRYSRIIDFIDR